MPRRRATEQDLIEEAAGYLAEYLRTGRSHTDLLRSAAPAIVELRSRHALEDGRVDWSGRSPGYRAAIGQVYERAHVPPEHMVSVQAAVRYHVGNLLRETAGQDELEQVGLTTVSPRQRLTRHRQLVDALAAAAAPSDHPNGDAARLATYAEALLENIDVSDATLEATDPARLGAAEVSLGNIAAHADSLLAALAAFKRRSKGKKAT